MEERYLGDLIDHFFNAELSVDEERRLYCYLRDNDVPAGFQEEKEAVMAFCGNEKELVLPDGAAWRLESILDELAVEQERESRNVNIAVPRKRIFLQKTFNVVSSLVAVVVVMVCMLSFADIDVFSVLKVPAVVCVETEEDTFDNPEDAMQCMKMALKDMQLAMNTTYTNAREVAAGLELMAMMRGDK